MSGMGGWDSDPSCGKGMKGGQKGSGKSDPWIEQQLDEWQRAKRNRDYGKADAIRAELRDMGIEPDAERPPGSQPSSERAREQGGCSAGSGWGFDDPFWGKGGNDWGPGLSATERAGGWGGAEKGGRSSGRDRGGGVPEWAEKQLDLWVEAKRRKDYATADEIRAELRANGINPDDERPPKGGGGGGQTSNEDIEHQLDRWVDAKRAKDFETADAIRANLRAKGIDPDTERPLRGAPPPKR